MGRGKARSSRAFPKPIIQSGRTARESMGFGNARKKVRAFASTHPTKSARDDIEECNARNT